jgi:hypothetical protein
LLLLLLLLLLHMTLDAWPQAAQGSRPHRLLPAARDGAMSHP